MSRRHRHTRLQVDYLISCPICLCVLYLQKKIFFNVVFAIMVAFKKYYLLHKIKKQASRMQHHQGVDSKQKISRPSVSPETSGAPHRPDVHHLSDTPGGVPLAIPAEPGSPSRRPRPDSGVPSNYAGMFYQHAEEGLPVLGRHPDAALKSMPEYVQYTYKHGRFASNCPYLPRASDISEVLNFKCTYHGADVFTPDGVRYTHPKPVVRGVLPSCGYVGFADPIEDQLIADIRMIASDKVDPTGVAHLDPLQWECSLNNMPNGKMML